MTQVSRDSGRNGQVYAQTGQTTVGYSGSSTTAITGGVSTTVTLANGQGLSAISRNITNAMFITVTDGVNKERHAVSSYAAGVVTIAAAFTHSFAIGSTILVGESLTLNTSNVFQDGINYAPYSLASAANQLVVDNPYSDYQYVAADGLPHGATIQFIQGQLAIVPPLQAGDTIDLAYDYAQLTAIGDMQEWKISSATDDVETTAFGEGFRSFVPTFRSWTGSAKEVQRTVYWWDAYVNNTTTYVKFVRNSAFQGKYWTGRAILSYDLNVNFNAAIIGDIKFKGVGPLVNTDL